MKHVMKQYGTCTVYKNVHMNNLIDVRKIVTFMCQLLQTVPKEQQFTLAVSDHKSSRHHPAPSGLAAQAFGPGYFEHGRLIFTVAPWRWAQNRIESVKRPDISLTLNSGLTWFINFIMFKVRNRWCGFRNVGGEDRKSLGSRR